MRMCGAGEVECVKFSDYRGSMFFAHRDNCLSPEAGLDVARIYLCLNYADFQNATIVNSACKFKNVGKSIFFEEAIWNSAQKKSEAAVRELVDNAIAHSDVVAFLIGQNTYANKFCQYALRESIEKKKGIFGIHLPNQMAKGSSDWLTSKRYPVHDWDSNNLKSWVITAVQKSLTKA